MDKAKELLLKCKGKSFSLEEKISYTIDLAEILVKSAGKQKSELARMVKDPLGKAFTAEVADQLFRSHSVERIVDQIHFILQKYGIPNFLSPVDKVGLWLFKKFGETFPSIAVPWMQERIRKESSTVILPGEERALTDYLNARKAEKVNVNLNRIGEAILGEEEARNRLQMYLDDLANPAIDYISVKISSICSQIHLVAKEETLATLADRLRTLYRAAGVKFVNLDMEEYRDLHLTVTLFKMVLSEKEFLQTSAGLVLQSYLPDSYLLQQEISKWAIERCANGGAPIKIRLVKGANLAMEQVEAAMRNWPLATYSTKNETDANYIQMINYGLLHKHAEAVHIGIGSHNLLNIAYALITAVQNNVQEFVTFEMLEGMAETMRKAVQEVAGSILLYSPVVKKEQFQNAIAYLVRRLDENTAPENFLSDSFDLTVDSEEWRAQVKRFKQSCFAKLSNEPKRKNQKQVSLYFENEPDTDWSIPGNSEWIAKVITEWQLKEEIALINWEELDEALTVAVQAQRDFDALSIKERSNLLKRAAQKLRDNRGNLIAAMCANTAKPVLEADPEVSEAIDFAEYYSRSVEEFQNLTTIKWHSKGVVLVAPPWNFPCSIPAGGIIAALAAGNSVLFKPAPEAAQVGFELVKALWDAGIDRKVLQFIPCKDDSEGSRLIQDQRIAAVVLTGATATAKLFYHLRPDLDLIAETGGKNAIIVTAMADRDLAIKDIVQSAFSYSGQKCSACSLLILEREVYEDEQFLKALKDAASSLKVGSPYDLAAKVNPLIKPPEASLKRALTSLEPCESWLLEPKQLDQELWSPGIKLNVQEGSFTHQTELFGPVLAVMCAEDLQHAIKIANGTPYGLTSGIHSLDTREQKFWMKNIISGNCYINRGITGAIVERQPFGGCKDSSFGKGAKAGGPNYLLQLMRPEQLHPQTSVEDALSSYQFYFTNYFSKNHDPLEILGEHNFFCYLPHELITLRVSSEDKLEDILKVIGACAITKTKLEISAPMASSHYASIVESDSEFFSRIAARKWNRLRMFSQPSFEQYKQLTGLSCRLHIGPVLDNGRLELLNYLREVSYSIDYHRYGYLPLKSNYHSLS